jgi:hypothetical protein
MIRHVVTEDQRTKECCRKEIPKPKVMNKLGSQRLEMGLLTPQNSKYCSVSYYTA